MASIQLNNASIDFPIYTAKGRSIKLTFGKRTAGGVIGRAHKASDKNIDTGVVTVKALKNLNATFTTGMRIGLVGRNGAGKTTLLRLLSGIYPPTSGSIQIEGTVSSLTDIMMGMDPEATGYENIILRGVLMGLKKREAQDLIPDIEEFTELGDYLNLPIRTYSSGMLLRLAFAVCTAVRPEILIMDEMIGAGDASFIEKAQKRLNDMIESAHILVLASHSSDIIARFCNTAIHMKEGEIAKWGHVDEVMQSYMDAA